MAIEVILVFFIFSLCLYSSYTDISLSVIKNKVLIVYSCLGVVVNVFYYIKNPNSLSLFLQSFLIASLISYLMYYLNFWAAGDCKLMMAISLLMPAGFLKNRFSLLSIIINAFIIAFFLLVLESLYLLIIKKKKISMSKDRAFRLIKSFLICYFNLYVFDYIYLMVFADSILNNRLLVLTINIIISIVINKYLFFEKKKYCYISISLFILVLIDTFRNGYQFDYVTIAVVLLINALRFLSDSFNYSEINIIDLKPGMILSFSSVLKFQGSRIKNLPMFTTEDLKTRINKEQVEAIKKWSNTEKGAKEITIVRKIPFAICLFISCIIFIIRG